MKLRIKGNSIRLRLSKSEVDSVARDGIVREMLHFPGGRALGYELRAEPEVTTPTAAFDGMSLAVLLPPGDLESWASTARVGISADVDLGDGESLTVLVQKDFECLHRTDREEDKSELYDHPGRDKDAP